MVPLLLFFDFLETIERRIVVEKLKRCNWNPTEAAEQFRMPLSALTWKIERLNEQPGLALPC
jgi:DNA-binding NtrC family response regulator